MIIKEHWGKSYDLFGTYKKDSNGTLGMALSKESIVFSLAALEVRQRPQQDLRIEFIGQYGEKLAFNPYDGGRLVH